MAEEEKKKACSHSGVPMSEQELKEWEKAFEDMNDCFKLAGGSNENKAGRKHTNR